MPRPDFVSHEDIARWSESIDKDLPNELASSPIIREVCYAGLWLTERLAKLNVPSEYIDALRYAAGQCSFGREPWEVHQKFLESYQLNTLTFDVESKKLN